MLAAIALAAVAFPAGGTYTYDVKTTSGARVTSTITISPNVGGLATHEVLGAPNPVVTTDQRFDAALRQLSYSGANAGGPALNISFSPTAAAMTVAGKTTTVALNRPACVLVLDNILTSSVMMPSLVRATGVTSCTYLVANGGTTVRATIATAAPGARPAGAAANDAGMSVQIESVTETLWYDPHTLVPDYMDFGNGASATLTATTANTEMPTAAPTATPFVSRFRSRDVSFVSKDGSRLAGTLSYPDGAGPFPAVILIQGSGVSDRDETVGPNHIFAELADALNARGYAVLRYDKRGTHASTSTVPLKAVVRADAVQDGVAATAYVRSAPDVNPKRVYFLGHSEGGEIVLGIALAGAPLRGVIMLSPLPLNYTAMLERQIARNHASAAEAKTLRSVEKQPYVESFNAADPVAEIRDVRLPLLLVHGSKDANVNNDDIAPFIAAAKAAHPRTFTDVELTDDDHLFARLAPDVTSNGLEYFTKLTLDPRLIDALASWLASH